ncbi:MAG TPA: hypothetical protein DDZ96_13360 [Porphyromonadaceae bacterium]|jgi:hypothetical protein|nr:hypothetical protein [Porphyromonadaceae bacterium]HBX21425.1 hypothetical protein [Porphyromonadaceae bacterium]HCM21922.1 hypothetical protein [Porphyromonadaceae bacterium]
MKQVLYSLGITLIGATLFACSPRVVTQVIKTYPPLPESEDVAVYHLETNDSVPATAETLGQVAVVDNGFSTKGSYPRVVDIAVEETRKTGGNALLITDHLKPSFWGSSIHQIGGTMLKVNPEDTTAVPSQETYISMEESNRRNRILIPVHHFSLNGGYGGTSAHTTERASPQVARFEDNLNNGINWDISYYYHHKGLPTGIGILFSQFYSNPFDKTVYENNEHRIRLDYAGISFIQKYAFTPQWLWKFSFGLGYLGYIHRVSLVNNPSATGKATGGTFGMHLSTGLEYRISDHFGVGFDISAINGYYSSLHYENVTYEEPVSDDNKLDASHWNSTLGMRYYF